MLTVTPRSGVRQTRHRPLCEPFYGSVLVVEVVKGAA